MGVELESTRLADRGLRSNLLRIDPSTLEANFDRTPFLIGHNLCGHSLFKLERLLELATDLPPQNVEYNAGEISVGCDPSSTPSNGLSADETIRRIQYCKSWIALKNVEADPEYRALLEGCLEEAARSLVSLLDMSVPEAFIFLSSPGSVTPYHMDPEHNFLLQIGGNKFVTVFDRSVVSAQEAETFYRGAHRNMTYKDAYLERSETFELKPGEGLHVPVGAPHFVRNGSSISVSYSVTFRTTDLERRSLVHKVNGAMRSRGLSPTPIGQRPGIDALKVFIARAARRAGMPMG